MDLRYLLLLFGFCFIVFSDLSQSDTNVVINKRNMSKRLCMPTYYHTYEEEMRKKKVSKE